MKLQSRNHGLDLLRVLACYMVLQVHAGEFYYIADGGLVAAGGEPVWACWLNSLCRTAVPLFVMLSGFFLLPVRERTRDFFARRFVRVVVPFLVWCVLYAIYQFLTGRTDAAGALLGVCRIPVNFGVEIGHLWFVYMLLGLYLFAPVVSPWIETASRRAMEGYLALWAFTLCIPYVHLVFPELLGECFWNDTPMLYYFSGFLGYMVLAAYLRRYHAAPRAWHKWGGALLVVAGYFATAWIFDARLATQQLVADLELSWGFGTINVGCDVGRAVPAAERRQAGGGPLYGRRYRHFETQLRHLPDTHHAAQLLPRLARSADRFGRDQDPRAGALHLRLVLCGRKADFAAARQQIRRRVATTRTPRRNAIAVRPSVPAGCRRS